MVQNNQQQQNQDMKQTLLEAGEEIFELPPGNTLQQAQGSAVPQGLLDAEQALLQAEQELIAEKQQLQHAHHQLYEAQQQVKKEQQDVKNAQEKVKQNQATVIAYRDSLQ